MKFTNYIKNILTLRYDPNKKPGRKPLTPKDFEPIDYKNHDYNVESKIINLIKDDLLKKQNQFRFKNVSLPLSSGIDSGITLIMIKKKLPETKIHCISVGFGKIMKVANKGSDVNQIKQSVIETAKKMAEEDIQTNMTMGKLGSELFDNNDCIMTHCNAGALATVAYGTALGVIRAAKESGKNIKVIATETRPVQQGSRLTAFELKHDGIDVSLIPDTAVGYSMAKGLVNKVIVGADRILRTGHVFNKIGTYQIATMAKQHNIPFYVAAPLSTFDLQSNPEDVIIEQRKASEVTGIGDKKTAPDDITVINPAFDMTPPELISGIITEKGVAKPPYDESIKKLFEAN